MIRQGTLDIKMKIFNKPEIYTMNPFILNY